MRRTWTAFAVTAAGWFTAAAQELPVEPAAGPLPIDLATQTPVDTVGGVQLPGVAPRVSDPPPGSGSGITSDGLDTSMFTDTRLTITVQEGTTEVITVSRGYLNRIVTPFENPKLVTVNTIQFQKEGSSIFLSAAGEAPVGVHIMSNDPADILDDIDEMATLPAQAFHVVESNGRTTLVSSNGHYAVVNGELWDMWNGFRIRSVADVERSLAIPLQRLGIGEALAGITLQTVADPPGGRVTLFLDPAAPEGVNAVTAARALLDRYAFQLVFVPAHQGRHAASQSLLCSQSAAQSFVTSGQIARGTPPEQTCGLDAMHRNITLVQVLGIDTLPFTVAPNGRVLPGVPTGYSEFLAGNEE